MGSSYVPAKLCAGGVSGKSSGNKGVKNEVRHDPLAGGPIAVRERSGNPLAMKLVCRHEVIQG